MAKHNPRPVPHRPNDDDFHPMAAMRKTALEVQYEQARMKPRDVNECLDRAMAIATQTEEIAEAAMYTLPERKGSDEKIQGPSVRLAEIAASQWGNIMIETHVVMIGEKEIVAEARGVDFETGNCVATEVRRGIVTSEGHRYRDNMITVTGNAACAIAYRNCVFKLIPAALIAPVYSAVRSKAVGDPKDLEKRRERVVARLREKLGISMARILAAVGVENVDDIDAEQLETLIGLGTAVNDGDVDKNEAFPPPGSGQKGRESALNDTLDQRPEPEPAARQKAAAEPAQGAEAPEAKDATEGGEASGTEAPVPPSTEEPPASQEEPKGEAPAPGSMADILATAASTLAMKEGIEQDDAKKRIWNYIRTKNRIRPDEKFEPTIDQAQAVLTDVKIVVDTTTIR